MNKIMDILWRGVEYKADLPDQLVLFIQSNVLAWSWKVARMGAIFLLLSLLKAFHNTAVSHMKFHEVKIKRYQSPMIGIV